jgi:hypothetical protein
MLQDGDVVMHEGGPSVSAVSEVVNQLAKQNLGREVSETTTAVRDCKFASDRT